MPRRRAREGVTPVVSDVLLTVAVVVSMTLLLAWVYSYVMYNPSKRAVQERFVIEDVWFNTTDTGERVVGIYIYNYGKVEIRVDAVYIGGNRTTDYVEGWRLELYPGQHGRVIVKFNWSPGEAYTVKVITGRGSYVEAVFVAPS